MALFPQSARRNLPQQTLPNLVALILHIAAFYILLLSPARAHTSVLHSLETDPSTIASTPCPSKSQLIFYLLFLSIEIASLAYHIDYRKFVLPPSLPALLILPLPFWYFSLPPSLNSLLFLLSLSTSLLTSLTSLPPNSLLLNISTISLCMLISPLDWGVYYQRFPIPIFSGIFIAKIGQVLRK
ncbi:hypothetical protein TrST_g11649 [Triparma strigata]|uniref:Uncharacterized protein n=1 Tax=Triparma strigata TaxID=1606541 RepID=A0A9W7ELL3_9STRA|nr:hypothetical protein TrST_g11649 [Triparma strigata]